MFRAATLAIFISLAFALPNHDAKVTSQHSAHQATVTTPQGEVLGSILTSRLGKHIYSFRGIRYAKAPVGELRFQPPVPIEKWDHVFNATEDGPSCPQPTDDPTSEDCLLLNVYTTKLPNGNENPKRPVVVYIHGGGWYRGSGVSSQEGPQYLLDQDIVLVVPNYRLGSLGFLSTGDKEAPGNNGLKDQVLVLKWVKENIASFGGNPDSVTLLGHSVGAASVTLHLVSPLSKGFFHRVIAMSGSIFGNWPIHTNQMELAKKQAKLLGCTETDTSEHILKCLKTKTADELGDSLDGFREFGNDPAIIWMPVIEQDFGQERFLTAHPIELIEKGELAKVPVILGVTTDEIAQHAFDVINNQTLLEKMDKEFDTVAPIAFIYERDSDHSKSISKELRKFYFEDKKIDSSTLAHLAQIYADGVIGFGVHRAAKLLADKLDEHVYYYKFDYKGRYSYFYLPDSNGTTPYGVDHNDALIYMFEMKKFPEFKNSDQEIPTLEKLTTMIANFAKTGNPTPEAVDKLDSITWEPFTSENEKYLNIGNKLVMEEKMFENRYDKWEELFPMDKITKAAREAKSKHG